MSQPLKVEKPAMKANPKKVEIANARMSSVPSATIVFGCELVQGAGRRVNRCCSGSSFAIHASCHASDTAEAVAAGCDRTCGRSRAGRLLRRLCARFVPVTDSSTGRNGPIQRSKSRAGFRA